MNIKKLALALLLPALILTGCAGSWHDDPITDVNDLGGRRVGVNLAWESDYALTGRSDLELYRYDMSADMILALRYDKVDALAVDGTMWKVMSALSEGLARTEPFGSCGYILYFGSDDGALAEDFNRYLAEYRQTEEYRDLLRRLDAFDGTDYLGPEIPLTGTGVTLRVAYSPGGFPHSFPEPGAETPIGFDLEALKYYANDRGLRLSFIPTTYEDALMGLQRGTYDVYAGYLSDVYREEVLAVGLYISDSLFELPLYFVQKTRPDFSIRLEELE